MYVVADTAGTDVEAYHTGGNFKHVWVNWDSGVSDIFPTDYSKYTMNTAAANSTQLGGKMGYIWTTNGAKVVKIRLEDEDLTSQAKGSDPDIIVASAKAYINSLNRLIFKKSKSMANEISQLKIKGV